MGRGNPQREEDDSVQLRSANDDAPSYNKQSAFAVVRVALPRARGSSHSHIHIHRPPHDFITKTGFTTIQTKVGPSGLEAYSLTSATPSFHLTPTL
jgi:hypothetical protein